MRPSDGKALDGQKSIGPSGVPFSLRQIYRSIDGEGGNCSIIGPMPEFPLWSPGNDLVQKWLGTLLWWTKFDAVLDISCSFRPRMDMAPSTSKNPKYIYDT